MKRARLLAVGVTLLLGGCATTLPMTPAAGPVPDLRGKWTGTWGGTPLTLVVLDQEEASTAEVYVGPWPLFGEHLIGLSGTLTFTVRGEAISVNFRGRLGHSNGRLALVLDPLTEDGGQITLTEVDAHRLAGAGASRVSWQPQGPVELARQAAEDSGRVRP